MFGIMSTKIVTTNLRIPDYNWLELKALAANQGISVNEYLNRLIDECAVKYAVAPDIVRVGKKKQRRPKNIWEALLQLSKMKSKDKSLGPLSDEDKAIYET